MRVDALGINWSENYATVVPPEPEGIDAGLARCIGVGRPWLESVDDSQAEIAKGDVWVGSLEVQRRG